MVLKAFQVFLTKSFSPRLERFRENNRKRRRSRGRENKNDWKNKSKNLNINEKLFKVWL